MTPAQIAAALTPTQAHVLRRCSGISYWPGGAGLPRHWCDVVSGRSHAGFRTIRALEKRELVVTGYPADRPEWFTAGAFVAATDLGLSVMANLGGRK